MALIISRSSWRHSITLMTPLNQSHVPISMMVVRQPTKRQCRGVLLWIALNWWTTQTIYDTLTVVNIYLGLMGNKTARPYLESFSSPFLTVTDLPHQGVMDSCSRLRYTCSCCEPKKAVEQSVNLLMIWDIFQPFDVMYACLRSTGEFLISDK